MIFWELQRGAWTCPFHTMEVRSEARWKRFPSPDLPSDHICCITEREQNRGFCNLIPLQHQTTGTNKATSHEVERHKKSRKRGQTHAVGPFSLFHFLKLTFRPVHHKGWKHGFSLFGTIFLSGNETLAVFVLENESRNCLTCVAGRRKHATWRTVTREASKKTLL